MVDLFDEWRRTIGCVTLVVAIAFMGLWARSFAVQNSISIPVAPNTSCGVVSGVGSIGVAWITDLSVPGSNIIDWQNNKLSSDDINDYDAAEEMGVQYCWVCSGIGLAESSEMSKTVVIIPYWSLVLPLTAISLLLLLSKPRKSTEKKIDEPIPIEGA